MDPDTIDEQSGLTANELAVNQHLVAAWDAFLRVGDDTDEVVTAEERDEMRRLIWAARQLLATRIARRLYGRFWK